MAARGLPSRAVFHHPDDARRILGGADSSRVLQGVSQSAAVQGLAALSKRGLGDLRGAHPRPSTRSARSVRTRRHSRPRPSLATARRQPPPDAPSPNPCPKTSCTMILGCASGIGAASEHALPSRIRRPRGGFASRLMQVRSRFFCAPRPTMSHPHTFAPFVPGGARETRTDVGINAASSLSDLSTTTSYVVGTFAPPCWNRV